MTVQELINALSEMPKDIPVVFTTRIVGGENGKYIIGCKLNRDYPSDDPDGFVCDVVELT